MSKKTIIFGILVIIWMGFIFYMSNDSGNDSDNKSHKIVSYIVDKFDTITNASNELIEYHKTSEFMEKANYVFRKICHFSEYFILSILLINFIISLNKFKILYSCLYTSVIAIIYSILDEFHQTFINGRSGNIIDVLIDSLGVIIGILIVLFINHILKKIKYQ